MANFKKPEYSSGKRIPTPSDEDHTTIKNYKHPIFCFKYLHKDYNVSFCEAEEKISLLERLVLLSQQDWQTLQLSPKHGIGSEKINRKSIIPSVPKDITEDVEFFLAFRFHGKAPFVGYRNKFIFHVVYIDRGFNVYPH